MRGETDNPEHIFLGNNKIIWVAEVGGKPRPAHNIKEEINWISWERLWLVCLLGR
jgi:hypothetical protein